MWVEVLAGVNLCVAARKLENGSPLALVSTFPKRLTVSYASGSTFVSSSSLMIMSLFDHSLIVFSTFHRTFQLRQRNRRL